MKLAQTISLFCLAAIVAVVSSCQKEIICPWCNEPPVARAGADQQLLLPADSVALNGTASADPDGTIAEWAWKQVSGPANAVFPNASVPVTAATKLVAGVYRFELQVTDNKGALAKDTLQVTVASPAANRPPVADAGSDQTITLPASSATLDGSRSADAEGQLTGYRWRQIGGPSTMVISQPAAVTTPVSGIIEGAYYVELLVTDAGGLTARDTVKITAAKPVAVLNCGTENRQLVTARLIPLSRLSEPSSGMATAAAGNTIVFAGASLSGSPAVYGSSAVHIYNTGTQSWSTASLSAGRADISIVSAGNKIFFAGGRLGNGSGSSYFATVDIYDVVSKSWSVASLSQPRAYIAAAAVGEKVFFAGGEQPWPLPVSDRVDVYDLRTDAWSTASLSVPRNGLTAVAANNKVFFAGGSNQLGGVNNVTDVIDIYNHATGTWTTSALGAPKSFFAGIPVGNRIFWAGGYDVAGNPTCQVEISDPAAQTRTTTYLFQPFSYVVQQGQNPVVKDQKLVWFATLDPENGNATDRFNIYDLATGRWAIGVLPFRLAGASVVCVNNTIYVAGGTVNGKLTDEVWRLDF